MQAFRHGWAKRIGYGIVLWALPYAISIPLLSLRQSDPLVFKNIMEIMGLVLGSFLSVLYLRQVKGDYVRESILLAATWVVVNWILDFGGILPFAGITPGRYFIEIGAEYIGMMAPIIAMGYLLEEYSKKSNQHSS